MNDPDPPALLSKKQRQYLLGEYEPSNETTMRHRIRRRIRYSMRDFSLLYHAHSDDERTMTFEQSEYEKFYEELRESELSGFDPEMEPEKTIQDDVIPGMADAVAYFYLATHDRDLDDENFAELIRNAVKQAVEYREGEDYIATVEVSIDHELRDERLSELREKFLANEQMTKDQLSALIEADPSVVPEAIIGQLQRESESTDDTEN